MTRNGNENKQVSLASAANRSNTAPRRKKKQNKSLTWLAWLFVLAVIVGIVVLIVSLNKKSNGPTLKTDELIEYTVTPDKLAGRTNYFVLGVLGEKPTDSLDALGVLCLDRRKDTAALLQIPVNTYVGTDRGQVQFGKLWGNPQELVWCPSCRCQVADAKKGDTHTCGAKLETRTGSSVTELMTAVNEYLGLPVDNYLLFDRDGLTELINELGGIDLTLEGSITVDGVTYEAGKRTLPGNVAVAYATQFGVDGSVAAEQKRVLRWRQFFSGVLTRIGRYKVTDLSGESAASDGMLQNIMLGTDPIRLDSSDLGKSRLMGSSENAASNTKYVRALAEFAHTLSKLKPEKVTLSVLPGVSASADKQTVLSGNRAQLLTLLREQMDPAEGLDLTEETVKLPQVNQKQSDADTMTVTLDTVAVEQSEPLVTTTAAETTTTEVAENVPAEE